MAEQYAGILTLRFWRAYLVTMRPYLLFVSGAAGAVGLAFIPGPTVWRVLLAFFPLFLSYGFGQALTDCFQTDTDSISSPYRPLVRGEVSRASVLWVSLGGLAVGTVIVGYLGLAALAISAVGVFGLITYTWFKRRWWGGPAWDSWIVATLPLIGRHAEPGWRVTEVLGWGDHYNLSFAAAIFAVFLGYANFVVMGYFKDVSADRQTGYDTFPVRFGWVPNAILSDFLALAFAVCAADAVVLAGPVHWIAMVVFTAGLAVSVVAQVGIHRIRDEAKSHGPIANVVRAFVLICLAMVLALKPGWWIPAAVFYALFEVALKLRPAQSQV